ncbi:S1 family peptidase [Rathayibacter toxicus]|uniref:S1 family peptidase n=2 Tax=Rathayibacter toxicus TaxID=145458 RepID=UPI0011B03195|nr:S1 family peptidase [Rathayibacter toxicus]QWL48845.1 hypothetical protein E2R43_03905 [Rathayibacter toxicus]QWL53243.1 hypothetical protein E2R45_03910 [Rathayibacter toxicus]
MRSQTASTRQKEQQRECLDGRIARISCSHHEQKILVFATNSNSYRSIYTQGVIMKKWLKKTVICCALTGIATASSTPALADISEPKMIDGRVNHVLIAGSYISSDPIKCTVGAILTKDGYSLESNPRDKNMRYAVTAAHCTKEGGVIYGEKDSPIGKTIDVDKANDTALIELYPLTSLSCDWMTPVVGGGGAHCIPVTNYRPRAVGQVHAKRNGAEMAIPLIGPGSPANGSQLCTSGIRTGVNCTFSAVPLPNKWRLSPRLSEKKAGYTSGKNIDMGDSGGPVFNVNGLFYGIISGFAEPGSDLDGTMAYTPAEKIFARYHGYSLAPRS